MTFDTFCPASGSRQALRACLDVAQQPNSTTRLLVVDGPVGCGKTHLLHAITNDVCNRRPDARVLCLSANALLEQLVKAIRADGWRSLVDRLSQWSLILIDDVFTLSGREFATCVLAHALEEWIRAGVLVVAASSHSPAQLAQLTAHIAEASRRRVVIRRPTDRQIVHILERRTAAGVVRHSTLRRLARQSGGDVGRALGLLTTAGARRLNRQRSGARL